MMQRLEVVQKMTFGEKAAIYTLLLFLLGVFFALGYEFGKEEIRAGIYQACRFGQEFQIKGFDGEWFRCE